MHDPGKIITDLAVILALGGGRLADIALLRPQPELFGPTTSGPTVSRLIDRLTIDTTKALKAIRVAREHAWALAGSAVLETNDQLIPIDLDATIVLARSDEENATRPGRRPSGFTP
ncbi:transposase [Streptosporangium canum]